MRRWLASHWFHVRGPAAKHWRAAGLIALTVLALGLSACGGSTARHGYLCLLGRSATDNGCYRSATWATADASEWYYSAATDMLVTPMTCTDDCLLSATRDPAVSGSGASATGGIFNFIQISDGGRNYFIRMGYGAIGGDGSPAYFMDYRLPVIADNGTITPSYRRVLLAPTGVPPAPAGGYRYARMELIGGQPGDGSPQIAWYACLSLPALSGRNPFQPSACTPAGNVYPDAASLDFPDSDGFKPTAFSIGQHVYGSSGATADLATFTNTRYGTVPAVGYEDGTGAQQPADNWHLVAGVGALQSSTPAPVPFAGWLTTPQSSPSNGGVFYAQCCQP